MSFALVFFLFVCSCCWFCLCILCYCFVFWGVGGGRDKLNASVALRYHGDGEAGSTHTKMGKFM